MANELVPQMEAAQSAYERETAALNAALQAHTTAARSEQGSAHEAERLALTKQIGAVHTAHVAALKDLEAAAQARIAAIEDTYQASTAGPALPAQDGREGPSPPARCRAPRANRPVCAPAAAADASSGATAGGAASPDGRRATAGGRRRPLPSAAYEAAAAAAAAVATTTESLEAQKARLAASGAAYREAAEAERFEREVAEEQLGRAREELGEALAALVRTERQLAEALSSSAAWREAALAKGGDLQMRRELGTRKATTAASAAARRAEQLALDVAALQADLPLTRTPDPYPSPRPHRKVLSLPVRLPLPLPPAGGGAAAGGRRARRRAGGRRARGAGELPRRPAANPYSDPSPNRKPSSSPIPTQVSFLRVQLQHEGEALEVSRAAEAGLVARLHEAVEAAAAAQLEVDYMRDQGPVHLQPYTYTQSPSPSPNLPLTLALPLARPHAQAHCRGATQPTEGGPGVGGGGGDGL